MLDRAGERHPRLFLYPSRFKFAMFGFKERFIVSRLLLIILTALIVVFGVFWFFRATVVSSYLSTTLGVPAGVEDVQLSTEGFILKGFYIENPPGSANQDAFYARVVRILMNPFSLFWSDPAEVDAIEMEGVDVTVLKRSQDGKANNWIEILNQMGTQRSTFGEPRPREKRFNIKKLKINGVNIRVGGAGTKGTRNLVPLGSFEVKDLGKSGFQGIKGSAKRIFQTIIQKVSQQPSLEGVLREYKPGVEKIYPKVPTERKAPLKPSKEIREEKPTPDPRKKCSIPEGIYKWYGCESCW